MPSFIICFVSFVIAAKTKILLFADIIKDGLEECKHWVPKNKDATSGSIYFVVPENDHAEIQLFKQKVGTQNALHRKILTLKLLSSYIYVGKDGTADCSRWSNHIFNCTNDVDQWLNNRRLKGFKDYSYYVQPYRSPNLFEAYESLTINELRVIPNHVKPLNIARGDEISKFIESGFRQNKTRSVLAYLLTTAVTSPSKILETTDASIIKTIAAVPVTTRWLMRLHEVVVRFISQEASVDELKEVVDAIGPLAAMDGIPCKRIHKRNSV